MTDNQQIALIEQTQLEVPFNEMSNLSRSEDSFKSERINMSYCKWSLICLIFISLVTAIIVLAISKENGINYPNCTSQNSSCNNEIFQSHVSNCNNTNKCNKNCNSTTTNDTIPTLKPIKFNTTDCNSYACQLLGSLDTTIKPCDNFYQYSCGNWIKNAEVDAFKLSQNGFQQQEDIINKRLLKIFESGENSSTYLKKAQTAYQACMNQNFEDELKLLYIQLKLQIEGLPFLEGTQWPYYNTVTDFEVLFQLLAQLRLLGWPLDGVLFKMDVMNDLFNRDNTILTLNQPQHSLFNINLAKIISNVVYESKPDIELLNKEIISFRNRIDSILVEESSNFSEKYTVITIRKFTFLTKIPSWLNFFNKIFQDVKTFQDSDKIAVFDIKYFEKMRTVFKEAEDYRCVINIEGLSFFEAVKEMTDDDNFLPYLSRPRFDVSSSEDLRWLECLEVVKSWFDVGLGVEYAKQFYDIEKEVESVDKLALSLINSYHEHLSKLEWLDKSSRKMAQKKLSYMTRHYLFPKWAENPENLEKFYENLHIENSNGLNFLHATKFFTDKTLNQLNPSQNNLEDWMYNTLLPNAFYVEIGNSFYVTTAILQPPIFQADRLQAMNYGGMGCIIGHEITHGFDLTGTQFNEYGNLENWFSAKVSQEFEAKSQCFIDQYSKFQLTPDDLPALKKSSNIDGSNTVSENIADNGGVQQSFRAYQKWVQENGPEIIPDILDEFTAEQIFFISYSQLWCNKYSNSDKLNSILEDGHSPAKFRVLGTLANFEEFYKAFNCPEKDTVKMCKLW